MDDQNQSSSNVRHMDLIGKGTVNPIVKQPQRSQTLMRSAVNRINQDTPTIASASGLTKPANSDLLQQKTSALAINNSMLNRANNTTKSDQVSRFGGQSVLTSPAIPQTAEPTPPAPAPVAEQAQTPVEQPSMNIFDQGIAKATAHNEPPILPAEAGRKGHKLVGALTASLLVIVGLGIFVNMNISHIEVYMASNKAGFSATLPTKAPGGFGLAKVSSAAGIVSTEFKSNSDSRSYNITERSSLWSSSTLLDSYVASVAGANYQTYQANGAQVYVYGSNATWVKNGIWYLVSSDNALSTSALINIASSMSLQSYL